jgi:hypothetical protein
LTWRNLTTQLPGTPGVRRVALSGWRCGGPGKVDGCPRLQGLAAAVLGLVSLRSAAW